MPITGNIHSSGRVVRPRRYMLLAVALVGMLAAFNQLGFNFAAHGQRRAAPQSDPGFNSNNCSYLVDPEKFRDAMTRHRMAVSRATVDVSERLPQGDEVLLTRAQDIPHKTFIDDILFDRMARDGVASAPICSDAEYLRRVTLDVTGRIPSAEDVEKFVVDRNPDKRDDIVETLINSPEYVDKWTMFFGDLFKNTRTSTNITRYRGGRDAFYKYIKESVATNKGYDRVATEMITAVGDSWVNGEAGFIVGGHVPMGPNQDIYDGYAVHTATTFLAINTMDCLLCHDGAGHLDAVNLWGASKSRLEAWGMAAFFARTNRTAPAGPIANTQKHTLSELTPASTT